jgi:integrase
VSIKVASPAPVRAVNPAALDTPPKNRLTPIAATITSIHGYPSKLVIYKSAASRYYWVRLYYNGKYKIKSTKTESVKDAKTFAVNFYEKVLVTATDSKTSNTNKSFAAIGHALFKSTAGTATASVHRTDVSRFKNDLIPFFGEQEIDTITNSQISNFIQRLKKRDLSPATIKHFLVVLRKVMKYAVANEKMRSLPEFPKVSGRLQTSQKRDYLTPDEYNRVIKSAESLARQNVVVRGVPITLEMKLLIQFMVNSFIRPSDLRVLCHRHVKKRSEDGDEWLALSHPATKTTAMEVQAMPASVFIYDRLKALRKAAGSTSMIDDFVFFPTYANRDTAMAVIARQFKKVVEHALIENESDKNITLYSLRHTAIMLRLINGNVETLSLAKNARTSQAMIEQFYAAHLTTDHVRKQLHAFTDKSSPNVTGKGRTTSKS